MSGKYATFEPDNEVCTTNANHCGVVTLMAPGVQTTNEARAQCTFCVDVEAQLTRYRSMTITISAKASNVSSLMLMPTLLPFAH